MTRTAESSKERATTPESAAIHREGPGHGGYIAVTGAGGSVGPAIAAALLERGRRVTLLTRPGKERTALDKVAQLVSGLRSEDVAAFGADLTEPAEVGTALAGADQRFGHAAALLNIAGGFSGRPATEVGSPDVEEMMAKNFYSAVTATKAALPGMLDRRSGFVLAIGAGAARQPSPGRTAYAAAKAALAAYFRSLSAELAGTGVGACILHPMGTIDTPANRQAMPNADFGSWISVGAVVEAALYLMAAGGPKAETSAAGAAGAAGRVPELELYSS